MTVRKPLQNPDNSDRVLYYNHDTPPELLAGLLELAAQNGLELKRRRPPKDEEAEETTPDEVLAAQLAQVKAVLADIGAEYDSATGMFLWNKQEYTPDSMAIRAYSALEKKNGLTKDAARCAMETFIYEERQRLIEAARVHVMPFDPKVGDEHVRRFVALMRGCAVEAAGVDPRFDLDVIAIQSLVWQIKRKFSGHTQVEHPLMVIFSGGQGFGKSWTLPHLFAPVSLWRAGGVKLEDLNNKFNVSVFNQYFVVPFEEMGPGAKYDIEVLKNIITEPYLSYRAPHKRETLRLVNNATCYGTTNHRAAQFLPDSTGARRWWEIECPNRAWTDEDAAKLAQIDFKAIWLSVDGSVAESPRRPFLGQMRAVQTGTLRPSSYLEQFFTQEVELDSGAPDLPTAALYPVVVEWFRGQGLRQPTRAAVVEWARQYGELFGISVKNHGNRFIFRGLRLPESDAPEPTLG